LDDRNCDLVQAQEVSMAARMSAAESEEGRRELSKIEYDNNRIVICKI
jgi:hypothetical protein